MTGVDGPVLRPECRVAALRGSTWPAGESTNQAVVWREPVRQTRNFPGQSMNSRVEQVAWFLSELLDFRQLRHLG